MSDRPHKRWGGPIGWLISAYRDDPRHLTCLAGVLLIGLAIAAVFFIGLVIALWTR